LGTFRLRRKGRGQGKGLARTNATHNWTAAAFGLHNAFELEPGQGLAHYSSADVERPGEGLLRGEHISGLEVAAFYLAHDDAGQFLREGLSFADFRGIELCNCHKIFIAPEGRLIKKNN
jgi:hypothetical protein